MMHYFIEDVYLKEVFFFYAQSLFQIMFKIIVTMS